jgi:mannose-6-phosphate isomerase class I
MTKNKINTSLKQPLCREQTNYPRGFCNPNPSFKINNKSINYSYKYLANYITNKIGLNVLVIDGYNGVDWKIFKSKLDRQLVEKGINAKWKNLNDCLIAEREIQKKIEPFIGGDDRIFGTHYPFGMEMFFSPKKIADYRIEASIIKAKRNNDLTIFYGCGAGLLEIWDELWYLDIPKDEIQTRARNKKISNFGEKENKSFECFYKRSYFIEWPAMNRQKKNLLPNIDMLIDLKNSNDPKSIKGNDFRKTLNRISRSPFRIRPWFSSGPWGGKYMQGHFGLNPDLPNIAWSFEIITPENGIVIENDGMKLEFSFDFLMFQENKNVLGNDAAKQFKYEWPIRLDYLDTIDGGNLSTQVHPRPEFVMENFGETFTQDESYYILNSKPNSKVYLGLQESCNEDKFYNQLKNSEKNGTEVDIDKFVNSVSSKPHDLFLIPNGTVHGSGKNNLVLEISATPYIFTFKIYDWLRKDLNGKMRSINIDRAWENIRFDRRSKFVKENLIAKPKLIAEGKDWKEFLLADKKENWWNVHRIEFSSEFQKNTNDTAFAINLVEGQSCKIVTENGYKTTISFAESMIIPAEAKNFKIINLHENLCKLVIVYVRNGIGKDKPLNDPFE